MKRRPRVPKACNLCRHYRENPSRCWDLAIGVKPDDVCAGWEMNQERYRLAQLAAIAKRNGGFAP